MGWKEESGKKLSKALYEIEAVKFGEFTLTSGKKSPYYIDLRLVPSFPGQCNAITDIYIEMIKNECNLTGKEVLVGVPTAGVPIAAIVAYKMKLPMAYIRKEVRKHGTGKAIEGLIKDDQRIIVIDDLVSTGKSNLETIDKLEAEGKHTEDIVLMVDRMQGGVEALKDRGVTIHSVVNILDLVKFLNEEGLISDEQRKLVEDYTK